MIDNFEKSFYSFDNNEDKIIVLESVLTMLKSGKKYSIEEIYYNIKKEFSYRMDFLDKIGEEKLNAFIGIGATITTIIGAAIVVAGIMTEGLSAVVFGGIIVFLMSIHTEFSAIISSNKYKEKLNKNEFFDKINEIVPDISKEEFDSLFDNIDKSRVTKDHKGLVLHFIVNMLDEYKQSEGVVTREEMLELISRTRNIDSLIFN